MNKTNAGIRQPGCQDPGAGVDMLPVGEALERILGELTPVAGTQTVSLREALDRVLVAPVTATVDVPTGTNSAMDGYALSHSALKAGRAELAVAGTAYAGHPYTAPLKPGECVRIMTGALMPAGTDTVVIQEHARRHGERVHVDTDVKAGDNVRAAGEDIRRGESLLGPGWRVGAAELGLLASLGVAQLAVRRPLKVAVLSTGDELTPVGRSLEAGQIHDSNRYTLYGMLKRPCTEVEDCGIIPDRVPELRAALTRAAAGNDVILSSGGVSVGEADLVRELLTELGSVHFWKVAMKPGRPLAFGRINQAWFFGLPGNPVSVMVTFQQLVVPALAKLRGERLPRPLRIQARCASRLSKRIARTEYLRGVLEYDDSGYTVRKTGAQGSGILRSMSEANCFIVLPADVSNVAAGALVEVEPFAACL